MEIFRLDNKKTFTRYPWDNEPDKEEFEHAGLPCILNRVLPRERAGHWCGYVAVPPGHPLHSMNYDTPDVEVHGGLGVAPVIPDTLRQAS